MRKIDGEFYLVLVSAEMGVVKTLFIDELFVNANGIIYTPRYIYFKFGKKLFLTEWKIYKIDELVFIQRSDDNFNQLLPYDECWFNIQFHVDKCLSPIVSQNILNELMMEDIML